MADREVKTPASRKRSLAEASTQAKTKRGRKLSTSRKGKAISTSKKKRSDFFDLADLPENVLLRIFVKAGYKTRLSAMQGLPPSVGTDSSLLSAPLQPKC